MVTVRLGGAQSHLATPWVCFSRLLFNSKNFTVSAALANALYFMPFWFSYMLLVV